MIYDAIEDSAGIMEQFFETDMRTVIADKGEAAIDPEIDIHKRRDALWIIGHKDVDRPQMGIYVSSALTSAKYQQQRESVNAIIFDYICRGSDGEVIEKQAELAVEAIMLCVDRMAGVGSIMGAGEAPETVSVDVDRTAQVEGANYYQERIIVGVPIRTVDTGLT